MILNTTDCEKSLKDDFVEKLENIQHNADMAVTTKCISEIIAKLRCGKSAGPDGICAEYFKFSNVQIGYITSALFLNMFIPWLSTKCFN